MLSTISLQSVSNFANSLPGCEERALPGEDSYQASSGIDTAALARLNSSNPGLSEKAWCPDPADSNAFVQVDLGANLDFFACFFCLFVFFSVLLNFA